MTKSISAKTITKLNPSLDCGDAQVRAQCRHLGSVVTVTGRVTAANVSLVEQRVRRYVLSEKPVVLDLSGVEAFGPQGISLLRGVAAECDAKGVEFCVITDKQVSATLRATSRHADFPTAGSVAEALKSFGDAVNARRRLLPVLVKTA